MRRYRKATGSRKRGMPGHLRIVCSFDDETFYEIRDMARASDVSFSDKVKELVEFGLEDVKAARAA